MINIETDVIIVIVIVMTTAKIGAVSNGGGGTAATKENATIEEMIVETSIQMVATKTGTTSGKIEVGRPVDIRKTY